MNLATRNTAAANFTKAIDNNYQNDDQCIVGNKINDIPVSCKKAPYINSRINRMSDVKSNPNKAIVSTEELGDIYSVIELLDRT